MAEPQTASEVNQTLERVDRAWSEFHSALSNFPAENVGLPIGQGWTRKQMLAHLTAWHDLTNERLAGFMRDGEPRPLREEDDEFNARVARAAEGRTLGEILDSLEASFRRLRRQISHLSEEQLRDHDGWAAKVIESNTYGHYAEHAADLEVDQP